MRSILYRFWTLIILVLSFSTSVNAQMLIALDPGHGGEEPGAQKGLLRESDIALDIAMRMKRQLLKNDFQVVMTRDDDTTVPLLERTKIANDANADVFISIHVNSAETPTLHGIETYSVDIATDGYSEMVALKENLGVSLEVGDIPTISTSTMLLSLELSELVQTSIVSTVDKQYEDQSIQDLGHKTAMFSVLVKAQMPAILLEVGFMSNPDELKHIESAHYRETMADGLTTALIEWRDRNQ